MKINILYSMVVLMASVYVAQGQTSGEVSVVANGRALDTAFAPLRVFSQQDMRELGASNLADLLRWELNMEIEKDVRAGGAGTRTFDMNSSQFKVLIDGVPVVSPDMFGGHVDVQSISLGGIERVELSTLPMGVRYGSGTLAGVVNLITDRRREQPVLEAWVQEETVGDEYNLRIGEGAKGRHRQQLAFRQDFARKWQVAAQVQRDAFGGLWSDFSGNKKVVGNSYQRGYDDWSPKNNWNLGASLSYQGKNFNANYRIGYYDGVVTYYDRLSEEATNENGLMGIYASTDYRYSYKRLAQHLQLQGSFWQDASYLLDFSWQDGRAKRREDIVNSETLKRIEKQPFEPRYSTQTAYAKGMLLKPFGKNLHGRAGYELEHTEASFYKQDGTYFSEDVKRNIFSYAAWAELQWRPLGTLLVQPGLRLSGTEFDDPRLTYALYTRYDLNNRNSLSAVAEQVFRYPNQRELFTVLNAEGTGLEGNTDLKPEKGMHYGLFWRNRTWTDGEREVSIRLSAQVHDLSDRIIIAADRISLESTIPQEIYKYKNVNHSRSLTGRLEVDAKMSAWRGQVGFSMNGTKGSDAADYGAYEDYLWHAEANASLRYTFLPNVWAQVRYHLVGKMPFLSLERDLNTLEVYSVDNHAPAYHIADISVGSSFLRDRLHVSLGVENLFDYKKVNFTPDDGLEHYNGDLRDIMVGYGRSFRLRLGYSF